VDYQHPKTKIKMSQSSLIKTLILLLASTKSFGSAFLPDRSQQTPVTVELCAAAKTIGSSTNSYLDNLQNVKLSFSDLIQNPIVNPDELVVYSHANFDFFEVSKLTSKGPRKNADVGQPHDATRPLVSYNDGKTKTGSWWCAVGGWPSPSLRDTTEVFYVFSGRGCVTDLDGMPHHFGPGDVVVLPKGWSGRWDVLEDVHKVWVTHDHEHVEEVGNPIRATIVTNESLTPNETSSVPHDASVGCPITASRTYYNVGPTEVGVRTCTPGSFPKSVPRDTVEAFHVLEGTFFVTNADGSAMRCGPGDTVVLPKGWTGKWDVIEKMKKIWVVINE